MTLQTQTRLLLATTAMSVLLAGHAAAQTADAQASSYNAGYGRSSVGQDNHWRNTAARSQDGNRLIVDGIIQSGDSYSSSSRRGGAWDDVSGAGVLGGATAIGNSLNVVVQGNRNTVIVNSTQINNGDVTAGVTVTPRTAGAGGQGTSGSPASAAAAASSSASASAQSGTGAGLILEGFDSPAAGGVGSNTLNGRVNLDDSGL